jgi:hypothetical protein
MPGSLVRDLCRIIARLALTDGEIAVLSAVAPAVVRHCRRDGRTPVRAPTRRRLAEFVERAKRAESRSDLGLP